MAQPLDSYIAPETLTADASISYTSQPQRALLAYLPCSYISFADGSYAVLTSHVCRVRALIIHSPAAA